MKNIKWIPRAERPQDKLIFDFMGFFQEADCNLDELAEILNYSVAGVHKMVIRGTIKRVAYNKLNKALRVDVSKFMNGRVNNGS